MSPKALLVPIAAAMLAWPVAAAAQAAGFYGAIDLGYHSPDRVDSTTTSTDENWYWFPGNDAAAFLRGGYAFDSDWRVELEGGYRPSSLDGITAGVFLPVALPGVPGVSLHGVGGHIDASTLMANGFYDIPLDLPVRPFIGGGIGLVQTDITAHGAYGFCPVCLRPPICILCTLNMEVDDASSNFGWQVLAGVTWPIAPRWSLDTTYRHVGASGVGWNSIVAARLFSPGPFRGDYADNSITVGIRYAFGD